MLLLEDQILTLERALYPHLIPNADLQRLLWIPGLGKVSASPSTPRSPGSLASRRCASSSRTAAWSPGRTTRAAARREGRGIKAPGRRVYHPRHRAAWLAQLADRGAPVRARTLYAELDVLRELRPQAKAAMLAEARRDPAWAVLQSIPFMGSVRIALLLAILQTPWRFRTKRNLWGYAGLAVVTKTSAEYAWEAGRPLRRRRAPLTRGLNRNHHPVLKDVFKGAASAATAHPGPLQHWYQERLARGMPAELARVTLARKVAAITLRFWKKGECFDPTQLTQPAR